MPLKPSGETDACFLKLLFVRISVTAMRSNQYRTVMPRGGAVTMGRSGHAVHRPLWLVWESVEEFGVVS